MNIHKSKTSWGVVIFLPLIVIAGGQLRATATYSQQSSPPAAFITPAELKTRIAKQARVTIVDVRSTNGLRSADNKIKGAIYVKLRRLKYRLGFPPLRDVSRDQEIVTYCACPNDESAIRAAEVLAAAGFKHVRVLKGGWTAWRKTNGQVEPLAAGL